MGFNPIKNLALSIAAIGMLPQNSAAGFDSQQYLLHSLSTAGLARKIALRLDDADPMDCFTAGLLHDFGKGTGLGAARDQCFPLRHHLLHFLQIVQQGRCELLNLFRIT